VEDYIVYICNWYTIVGKDVG